MKKALILNAFLILVLTLSTMGLAQAKGQCKGFEKKDTNADGTISLQEFIDYKVKRFSRMDANKDGTVTKTEAEAYATEKFKIIDTDKNGQVTSEEMKVYWETKKK